MAEANTATDFRPEEGISFVRGVSRRSRERLGWSPRQIENTIAETAESLIEHGVVKAPAV